LKSAIDRYVVIGNPIEHSKSPQIHAMFAAQTGQAMQYERLAAPLDGFANAVRELIAEGARGANVTVPFKLNAHALATTLSDRARAAGAVNTLLFSDGDSGDEIGGDNTDGVGLVTDIICNAHTGLQGKRILLLGAGGAARGVLLPLLEYQPSQLVIANRSIDKAAGLVHKFSAHGTLIATPFAELDGAFDIVINATAASLSEALPPIPASVFSPDSLAYDMMYAAAPTIFLRFAAQHGATIRDGLGMLVEQAAEAFFLWRGVRPQTELVLKRLRAAL
jgi:shikimate dehydrogenase